MLNYFFLLKSSNFKYVAMVTKKNFFCSNNLTAQHSKILLRSNSDPLSATAFSMVTLSTKR